MCYRTLLGVILMIASVTMSAKQISWFDGRNITYKVSTEYATVVDKALDMFCEDMACATGVTPRRQRNARIEIFQLDKATAEQQLQLTADGVPCHRLAGVRDAFWLGVRKGRVVVVGSNGRGTAYGILELSRMAGVSPWIYWGDVVPERKTQLTIDSAFETLQMPSVEFRGVFINDEDWSSRVWSHNRLDPNHDTGVIGPAYYRKLFELLLRLHGNTLWPAMHEGTAAFFTVDGNKELADSFDIFVGSSHCEQILRNNVGEWDEKTMGPYNWITNRPAVESYWRQRARETSQMDVLYTIGMRGIHDGSMQGTKTLTEKREGLQSVIDFQRQMLSEEVNHDLTKVPQVFIPYKEVLEIYESGLTVPDDVMLMWCDDNYGYMTRLSDAEQQKRSGGAGVYYHLSYWGRPHDYLWLTTTQPGLIYNEMRTAYDNNARRLWIANVHDPKAAAYDLSLFMDMAWNIDSVRADNIETHLQKWLVQQFGDVCGQRLTAPMKEFYRLCGVRRPEFMGWNQVELDKKKYPRGWSPVQDTEFRHDAFGNELERYLSDFKRIRRQVDEAAASLRPELKDAFFTAIQYPVYCAGDMAEKQLMAQEARRLYAADSTDASRQCLMAAAKSMRAYNEIVMLTEQYNKLIANGKWDGLMSMAPRGLYVFSAPDLPITPTPAEISEYGCPAYNECPIDTEGCIVRNAADYDSATDGVLPIDMLGHSMKAVAMPKDGALTYCFNISVAGDYTLYTMLIPTQANDRGDIRYSVSVDGETSVVYSLKEKYRSEMWKLNVLRGQSVRQTVMNLSAGRHTLVIKALDNHIVVDQWMLDGKDGRQFYMLPI